MYAKFQNRVRNAEVQRVQVNDYILPLQVGISGQVVTTDGNGQLSFTTVVTGSGSVIVAGNGVDNTAAVFTDVIELSASVLTITDTGSMSGITDMSAAGTAIFNLVTYPVADASTGFVLMTDGSGVLSFEPVSSGSGPSGTGTDKHLVRFDISNNLQDSLVTITDSGDMLNFGSMRQLVKVNISGNIHVSQNSNIAPTNNITNPNVTLSGALRATFMCCLDCSISPGTDRSTMFSVERGEISATAGPCVMGGCHDHVIGASAEYCSTFGSENGDLLGQRVVVMATDNCSVSDAGNVQSATVSSDTCNMPLSNTDSVIMSCTSIDMGGCTSSAEVSTLATASISGCQTSLFLAVNGSTMVNGAQCAAVGMLDLTIDASGKNNIVALATVGAVDNTGLTGINSEQIVFSGSSGVRRWLISSVSGVLYSATTSIGNPVPDFAEYFENYYGGAVTPVGSLVTLKGRKVAVAQLGDKVIGVVSSAPGIVAGGSDLHWQGVYQRNKWGIVESSLVPKLNWSPGPGERERDRPLVSKAVKNPAYNKKLSYTPRSERPGQWTCVGLVGQVRTRVGNGINEVCWLAPGSHGNAKKVDYPTKVRFIKLLQPYRLDRGCGIALCLVK